MPTIVALFVLLSASSISVSSEAPGKLKHNPALAVTDSGSWKTIQRGVEFRKMTLERSEPSHSIDLKLLRFDKQWIVPRILRSAQFQLKGANAKTFAEKSAAIATINANYFDTEGKPLAFLKVANQPINSRVAKTSLYTGIFSVKNQRPLISHRDHFLPEQADEGLQSGPLLLLHGTAQAVTGVSNRASRRALIGIDHEQRLVIAVADSLLGGLHWPEIQEIFTAAPWQIQVTDLLNLDGGGSAQLYVKAGKFEESVMGTAEVPVAIGLFNRTN
ncbi:MAG TPA: phosphodiester glycosidase family protein [Candidatus Binatia bacterium]|nr:phosphodiester glycosidase family protein [Candidatus Binatia bacterium]